MCMDLVVRRIGCQEDETQSFDRLLMPREMSTISYAPMDPLQENSPESAAGALFESNPAWREDLENGGDDDFDPDEFDSLNATLQQHDGGLLVMASDCELIEGHQDQLVTLDVPVLLAR